MTMIVDLKSPLREDFNIVTQRLTSTQAWQFNRRCILVSTRTIPPGSNAEILAGGFDMAGLPLNCRIYFDFDQLRSKTHSYIQGVIAHEIGHVLNQWVHVSVYQSELDADEFAARLGFFRR